VVLGKFVGLGVGDSEGVLEGFLEGVVDSVSEDDIWIKNKNILKTNNVFINCIYPT